MFPKCMIEHIIISTKGPLGLTPLPLLLGPLWCPIRNDVVWRALEMARFFPPLGVVGRRVVTRSSLWQAPSAYG